MIISISQECLFPVTWNFRCRHIISCPLRWYHRWTTEVAHICTTYYGTKCDASVTGCEHIYHSIFKNWYLRTETSQGHEIWHVYSHMSLLNRQKKKKGWKIKQSDFFNDQTIFLIKSIKTGFCWKSTITVILTNWMVTYQYEISGTLNHNQNKGK